MSIELTDSLKAQIVLTAVGAAGPGATDDQIVGQVSRITGFLQDGSPALNAFERAEKRAANTTQTKGFQGDVLWVDLEQSSNRPIVFLRTAPSEHHPDGIELIRMDRTDSADGERSKELAKLATSLIGHKVGVSVAVEKAGTKNVRVLRALEDRGPVADLAGYDVSNGYTLVNWQEETKAKIAPKLARLNKVAQAAG
jgi:hypothetical protein